MTDRVKLVKLIDEVAEGMIIQRCGELVCTVNSDEIADHLLANGVTMMEQQKQLDVNALLSKFTAHVTSMTDDDVHASMRNAERLTAECGNEDKGAIKND